MHYVLGFILQEDTLTLDMKDMGILGVGGKGILWHARWGGVHDMITYMSGQESAQHLMIHVIVCVQQILISVCINCSTH